jgi:protein-L-isoaspartate(D-aspartate) O-methyltransferase
MNTMMKNFMRSFIAVLITSLACVPLIVAVAGDLEAKHQMMLKEIADDFKATADFTGRSQMQPLVEKAMAAVSRHEFVMEGDTEIAYINRPLRIGHGQTISQPYIVAIMTDLLDLEVGDRVLEIGTGSGYQAAVLAEITDQVYSIEIIEALAVSAAKRLQRLGYDKIQVRAGDGNYGWPEAAPFDAIVVTAGGRLPPALVEQLKPGGRLVIPINQNGSAQELTVYTKQADGKVTSRFALPVRFVPLKGDN